MPTLTLELPEETAAALQEAVAAGRYRTAQDAVLDALAIWETRETEEAPSIDWQTLKRAVEDGIASGPAVPLSRDEIMAIARGETPVRG
jgi:putative addiction module CopG family antidote